jgi:tetratricopeptide (TPR) repeat protein
MAGGNTDAALASFQHARDIDPQQPGLHLKLGDAYLQMKRWQDAQTCFDRALELDPDSAAAFLGRCRSLLPRRQHLAAAEAALDSVGLVYYNPMGHFLLGVALHRLNRLRPAIEALSVAVIQNPDFPEAHRRLAHIFDTRMKDPETAAHHRKLARDASHRLKTVKLDRKSRGVFAKRRPMTSDQSPPAPLGVRPATVPEPVATAKKPVPWRQTVIVVSGLPRAGTSMVMQMLQAGGIPLLADNHRPPDKDNPRGYFEYQPVKGLRQTDEWLARAAGKAVKVVAPLLDGIKPGPEYRVVLVERDLEEVLGSQRKMLENQERDGGELSDTRLKTIYAKQIRQVKRTLSENGVPLLCLDHRRCITDPSAEADRINAFLGGRLDTSAMAAAVDPALYRQRG